MPQVQFELPEQPIGSATSATSQVSLLELTFPDITQKSIRAWGIITFSPGSYVKGGLFVNLMQFADDRAIDFNGFLRCKVWNEDPVPPGGINYTYHYAPTSDVVQIFNNGVELATGTQIPAAILNDDTLFLATWDRTNVRG
jgi:hypothetical protein